MPSLALVCAYAKVFITVWRPFLSEFSSRFIDTTSTIGGNGSNSGGGTISFGTFLFRTFDIDV